MDAVYRVETGYVLLGMRCPSTGAVLPSTTPSSPAVGAQLTCEPFTARDKIRLRWFPAARGQRVVGDAAKDGWAR